MLHTMFQGHQFIGSGEEDFLGFYHIWAWQPSEPDHLNNFSKVPKDNPFMEHIFIPKGPEGCRWNMVTIGPMVSD